MRKIIVFVTCLCMMVTITSCGEQPVNQFVGEWEPISVTSEISDVAGNSTESDMTEWMLGNYGDVKISNDGLVEILRNSKKDIICTWEDEDTEDDWLELTGKTRGLGRHNIHYENDEIEILFWNVGDVAVFHVIYTRK